MRSRGGSDPAAEAAAHYARLHGDAASDEAREALNQWRAEDPAHDAAWRRVQRTDDALASLRDDPAIAALRASALAEPAAGSRRWLPLAAAAAITGGIALGATAMLVRPHPAPPAASAARVIALSTQIGELRTVRLADGTRLTLDAASTVRVHPAGAMRQVDLVTGRAMFAVAHDAAHPFVVTGGGATVTALGTRFAVERGAGGVVVALTEGKVRVATSIGARVLAPGDVLTTRGGAIRVASAAAAAETGWQHGRLTFSAVPLGDVAAQLQRYDTRRVVIRDQALAARPFSGSIRARDGSAALVAALEAYGVARVGTQDAGRIELVPR